MCSNIAEHVGPSAQDSEKEVPSVTQIEAQIHGRRKQSIFRCTFGRMLKPVYRKTLMLVQPSAGPLLYTLGAIPDTDKGRWKEDLQCHSTVGVCSRKQREHQDVSRLQMAIAVQARSVTKPLLVNSSLQVTLNSTSAQHLWCWKQKIVDSKPDPREKEVRFEDQPRHSWESPECPNQRCL